MIFRPILLASALAWGVSSIARPLNGGWTADGAPVTLPHCWNVEDGTDGPTDPKANNHDSVVATNDFQTAIDAVAVAGGGTVRVPPGDYVTGGVWLKSHVTLELSEGARLVSNGDLATYANRRAMVYAENAEDVALVGRGEVCGSGEKFPARDNASGRPFDVLFRTCRDFRIEGVRLTDSAACLTYRRALAVSSSKSWTAAPWKM